ncbi:hypothetical protein LCGC14_0375980 [marine sediment metagenome]|uniref:Uncharacterized protein n=1 Tax=marine sediment metagenome TaxID=412755 RepID=A0A0F9T3Q7_9ZZZZ
MKRCKDCKWLTFPKNRGITVKGIRYGICKFVSVCVPPTASLNYFCNSYKRKWYKLWRPK